MLADAGLNIIDMVNKSHDDIAVTLMDVDARPSEQTIEHIAAVEGVLSVRCLECE